MRREVRAAGASAVCLGLLVSACGGHARHGTEPLAGGHAQPSSEAPEPPASGEPASPAPSGPTGAPVPTESPPAATTGPRTTSPAMGPLEIRTRETKYGRILVDGPGRTIYVADRDNADFESTCSGACTKDWPPLFTNGQVTAGEGVNSAWLGTIGRTDGPTQVEYNGWPLYYSARDTRPGDINGQGVSAYGTTWHVIDADKGQKVK